MIYYCFTRWLLVLLQWIYVSFGSQITGCNCWPKHFVERKEEWERPGGIPLLKIQRKMHLVYFPFHWKKLWGLMVAAMKCRGN